MHLAMSMSNRVITRTPSAFFIMSILMQSIGQAFSQAKHAVQMSMSTSRIPR